MTASHDFTLAAVHLPKTAGTSFLASLQRVYGERIQLDYGDRPLAHSRLQRRAMAVRHAALNVGRPFPKACVYGHYMPLKYASMQGMRFCSWLRDPVQRVLSRYHHYLRHAADEQHHARWGLVPGLSIEEFVRLPQYQNTYAEYFWMFSLEKFDFIGIFEDYDEELDRFAESFGIEAGLLAGETRNRNPDKVQASYSVEPAVERLIRACNRRDIALYERALERKVPRRILPTA